MNSTIIWASIGTIVAAFAVLAAAWQAFETRRQVAVSEKQSEKTGEQFQQSRYDNARPILVVASSKDVLSHQGGGGFQFAETTHTLDIQNIGNGTAFRVRATLAGNEFVRNPVNALNGLVEFSEKDKPIWFHQNTDIVRAGEPPKSLALHQANLDHWKRTYIESKEYSFYAPITLLNGKVEQELCRVVITYHDVFHRKHASIYDCRNVSFIDSSQGVEVWKPFKFLEDIVSDLDDLRK